MTERRTKQAEQPISVEIGQIFRPFEGLQELPLYRDRETFVESADYVASREFEFKGIKATIALTVPDEYEAPDLIYRRSFKTPLGVATFEYQYEDCKEDTVKTPLQLAIFSSLGSIEDYVILSQYQFDIKIGNSNYSLDCTELFHKDKAREISEAIEIIKEGLAEDGDGGAFVSRDLKDHNGNAVTVALPYDPSRLSTIEIQIVKKL
mgnify:CR=1 FL=1